MSGITLTGTIPRTVILGNGGYAGPVTIGNGPPNFGYTTISPGYGDPGVLIRKNVLNPTLVVADAARVYGGSGYNGGTTAYAGGAGLITYAAASVTNIGFIIGGAGSHIGPVGGDGGDGVVIDASGALLDNEDGIGGGQGGAGSIMGGIGGIGVYVDVAATLINDGFIIDGAGGNGAEAGVSVKLTNGATFFNGGYVYGRPGATGVFINGGTFTNNLVAYGGQQGTGVFIESGFFTNSGRVSAGPELDPAGLYATGVGVVVTNTLSTVLNDGAIFGGAGTLAVYAENGGAFVNVGYIRAGTSGTAVKLVEDKNFSNSSAGRILGGLVFNSIGLGGTGIDVTASASFTNAGSISGGNGAAGGTGVYLGGGTVTNTGIIAGGSGQSAGGTGVYINGGTFIDNGEVFGGSASSGPAGDSIKFGATTGTLVVEPGTGGLLHGNIVANFAAGDVLALAAAGTNNGGMIMDEGGSFTGFSTVSFDPGAAWLLVAVAPDLDQGQTITGFTSHDVIVLQDFTTSSFSYVSGTGLELSGNSGKITLDFIGNYKTSDFSINGTEIETDIACFCAGTNILTLRGDVPIEDIRPGEIIVTVRKNGPATGRVVWTGKRKIDITRHSQPGLVQPVRIMKDALGFGIPSRDLRVSPQHCLYIEGALFEAIGLVNGLSIIHEQHNAAVTYYHIELETHDIILAEGLAAETFLDTGNRNMFADQIQPVMLHADFRPKTDMGFCATVIREPNQIARMQQSVLARAARSFSKLTG